MASPRLSASSTLQALAAALVLAACTVGINRGLTGTGGDGSDAGATAADLMVDQSGLPCDVARILTANCLACHGTKPLPGVPGSLVSYEDLTATAPRGGSWASRALSRMKDTIGRMPPAPASAVPDADIALFEAWVSGGTPRGSCQPNEPDLGGADFAMITADLAGQVVTQAGLSCEIAAITANCIGCHGHPPSNNAPSSYVTRDDFLVVAGGASGGARAVARINDAQAPMPPAPNARLTAQQIATFEKWVADGMPEGSCSMAFDGGVPMDPFNTPDVCTSKMNWPGGEQDVGNLAKDNMHPGRACIDCHTNPVPGADKGPELYFAGTVYPTAHEPDECMGESGQRTPATVEITDSANHIYRLTTTVSGNFYLRPGIGIAAPVFPIKAVLKAGGKTRAMVDAVPSGDCNSCHTLRGTMKAPGRIMLP